MACDVYSLPDTRTVLSHPDVGACILHQCGHGKITVSAAGDLTSHTMPADGYVVVTLKKIPDRVYDRTAASLVYTLLATTITEQ